MVKATGSLSDDGRYISFASTYPHVAGDTDDDSDVYVLDRNTSTYSLADAASPYSTSRSGAMSSDGRYVVLIGATSVASNTETVRLVDRVGVSVTSLGGASFTNYQPRISPNGRYIAWTTSLQLVGGDTDLTQDTYVYDRVGASLSMAAMPADMDGAYQLVGGVTSDGRYVLLTGNLSGALIDRQAGKASFVSTPAGLAPDGSLAVPNDFDQSQATRLHIVPPMYVVADGPLRGPGSGPIKASLDQGSSQAAAVLAWGSQQISAVDLGQGITVTSLTKPASNEADFVATVSGTATPGPRTITLTSTTGCVSTYPNAFTVADVHPDVTAVTPSVLRPGQATTLTVDGERLSSLTSVTLGSGITVGTITPVSDAQVKVAVTVAGGATSGLRTLTLNKAGGISSAFAGAVDVETTRGELHPLSPARILDTRTGVGGRLGALGPTGSYDLTVTGVGGVPASGVDSVIVNVTATASTTGGYLTVHPTGAARPNASNLNFAAGSTVPNLVTAKVGTGGRITIYNDSGSTHVIGDVVGWYGTAAAGGGSRFAPITPTRVYDSRFDPAGPFWGGEPDGISIPVPVPNVSAVMLNVTATGPTSAGYLTIWPGDEDQPDTSNLNFTPGQSVPNMVVVPIEQDGNVGIYNSEGLTDVIIDVVGYFSSDLAGATAFTSATPVRALDTRTGTGGPAQPIGAGATRDVTIAGANGVPAGAVAVLANFTATAPTAGGYLTTWPTGEARPGASTLNFTANQTVANLAVVPIGSGGAISVYNAAGTTHTIADVNGWFS